MVPLFNEEETFVTQMKNKEMLQRRQDETREGDTEIQDPCGHVPAAILTCVYGYDALQLCYKLIMRMNQTNWIS